MANQFTHYEGLSLAILDILPNPVLIKDSETRYFWVNRAFEDLFGVERDKIRGHLDKELFPDRQVAQCNGGDLRVLETGEVDEATEEVYRKDGTPCETITRKSRLILDCGTTFLVGVMHDVTEVYMAARLLEENSAKLRTLANTDSMTGCMNRRALFKSFEDKENSIGGLLAMDIDLFKSVNDTYGHDMGDAAIVNFAETIRKQLREEDMFARVGGEEFVVFMPGINEQNLETAAIRIREAIENTPLEYEGYTVPMIVSIGGSIANKESATKSIDEMLKEADKLLYVAKHSGRNCYKLAA